jgi:hypothetical protein
VAGLKIDRLLETIHFSVDVPFDGACGEVLLNETWYRVLDQPKLP